MSVLPDYLAPNLRVVFCGTAAGNRSAAAGHYYSGPSNEFWALLHGARILPVRLSPSEDADVLRFGIGLTDLAKKRPASRDDDRSPEDFDVSALIAKMERYHPARLTFHGKTAAKIVSGTLGRSPNVALGRQEWTLGGVKVFVVPSASAANRSTGHLEGKCSRLAWFQALAGELRICPPANQASDWAHRRRTDVRNACHGRRSEG